MKSNNYKAECEDFNGIFNKKEILKVPVYQRSYTWGEQEIEDLLNDIEHCVKNDVNHFCGMIAALKSGADNEKILNVVDGQQRLITISLIFLCIQKNKFAKKEGKIPGRIDVLLKNETSFDDQLQIQPSHINGDFTVYDKLIRGQKLTKQELQNPINKAYEKINLWISNKAKNLKDIQQLYKIVLNNLEVIYLTGSPESEHVIFECVNAKGKDLTQTDLIRNKLLGSLYKDSNRKVEEIHQKVWVPIEEKLSLFSKDQRAKDSEFETFFMFFIMSHFKKNDDFKKQNLERYRLFSDWVKKSISQDEVEIVLRKINREIDWYIWLKDGSVEITFDNENNLTSEHFLLPPRALESDSHIPAVISILRVYFDGKISYKELHHLLETISIFNLVSIFVDKHSVRENEFNDLIIKINNFNFSDKKKKVITCVDSMDEYFKLNYDNFLSMLENTDWYKSASKKLFLKYLLGFLNLKLAPLSKVDYKYFSFEKMFYLELDHIIPDSICKKNEKLDKMKDRMGNLRLMDSKTNKTLSNKQGHERDFRELSLGLITNNFKKEIPGSTDSLESKENFIKEHSNYILSLVKKALPFKKN